MGEYTQVSRHLCHTVINAANTKHEMPDAQKKVWVVDPGIGGDSWDK